MNRSPGVVLVVLVLLLAVAGVAWWLESAAPVPAAPGGDAPAAPASAPAATGSLADPAALAATATPATLEPAGTERFAAPASAVDDRGPAVVGRVVGPDGAPVAGATVVAVPGMAFANATGQLDFDTFDAADFDDVDAFDPVGMMRSVKGQLAQRVEVLTDADGRFRVRAAGTTRGVGLRVLARGHALLDRRIDRPRERDVDAGTLVLERGAIVSGRVVDPSGEPVPGAQVSRIQEMEARMAGGLDLDMPEMAEVEALRGGEAATTDAQGRFELAHVAAGDVALRARHPERPTTKTEPVAVASGAEQRDVLITMRRGGEIRGVVHDLPDDRNGLTVVAVKRPRTDVDPTGMMGMIGSELPDMLAEMGLAVGDRTAPVATDGTFVLRGLARDVYRVWVVRTAPGTTGSNDCSARVEAMPDSSVELRFDPGVSVTFTAVDAVSGEPLEKLWVREHLRGGNGFAEMMAAMRQRGRLATYPGGQVTITSLRPKAKQKLALAVEAVGYRTFEREDVELPRAGNLDLGLVKLERAPVLEVTVVDALTGAPIRGAKVGVVRRLAAAAEMPFAMPGTSPGNDALHGRTGDDGRCTLNRFPDGEGLVTVDADDYAPFASERLTFGDAAPRTLQAALVAGGTTTVTVADPEGVPVAGAVVEHDGHGGGSATIKTDARGVARFVRLPPGDHRFRLTREANAMARMMARAQRTGDDDAASWSVVTVADRAEATLALVQQPTASVHGVVRENGVALDGARVTFRDGVAIDEQEAATQALTDMMGAVGGGGSRSVKTDERGEFRLSGLPEGAHRLQVTHSGRAMPASVVVELRHGDNVCNVELGMTSVRGVVHDPAGQPVDGARIRVRRAPRSEDPDISDAIDGAMEGMLPGMGLGGRAQRSDSSGGFELRGVDPDVELVVQASAKGFAPASVRVTASRGTTVEAPPITLGAAGKIRVTSSAEGPFTAARARFVGDGESVAPVVQMLRNGKGTLDGLRPGTWEVRVDGMNLGGEPRVQRVEVVAGQTVDVEL